MENRTYKFFKGSPLYPFGFGLTYSKISESWVNDKTVDITNEGTFDTAYSVLLFKNEPHKELVDFKKIFVKAGQTVRVEF